MAAYPGSLFLGLPAAIFMEAGGLIFVWVFFSKVTSLQGWTLGEIFVIFGMARIGMGLGESFCGQVSRLGTAILSGELDRLLFRPANRLLLFINPQITVPSVGSCIVGITLMAIGFRMEEIGMTLTQFAWILFSAIIGALVYGSLLFLSVAPCFWLTDRRGFISPVMRMSDFSCYPIPIFGKTVRSVLTYILPFAFVGYYPSLVILRPEMALPCSPLISLGVALFLLSVVGLVWMRGLRRYRSPGS